MKEPLRPAAPVRAAKSSRAGQRHSTRFTLELLETLTAGQESRGYDPYNAGKQTSDIWFNKPKRR